MKWQIVQLQKIASEEKGSIVSGPFGSNISAKYFVDEGIPVIRGNNLTKGAQKFIDDGFVYLTETKAVEFRNCIAIKDDIVFTAVGSIGQVGIIPNNTKFEKYVISNKQLRVRIDKKKADPMFVYYWLSCPRMTGYLEGMNNGGAVPLINLGIIRRVPVPVPPLDTQSSISAIVSNFNDSIDTNRRRVQLLEEAARLLFREWFVYFRFPGHEEVKIVDGVPEGWEKEKINKLVAFKRGVEPGSDNYLETYESGSFPFFRVSDLVTRNPSIFVDEQYAKSALLKKSDIVISLDGSVGIVSIGLEGCYSTGIRKLIIKDKKINRAYLYFLMKSHYVQGVINAYAKGTTIQHAGEAIKHMNSILPSQNLMDLFDEIVNPALNEILILLDQNQKLTQARDLILPRLMSGAIEV